jgi:hypothetical protein
MTIENANTPAAIEEAAIRQAADQIIRTSAAKHGMTFEQVPQDAKDDAYRYAAAAYAEDQAQKVNPVYAQLQAEREAHRITQMTLDAVKQTRPAVGTNGSPSSLNPDIVRAQMGEGEWRALTDNGRLQVCGINPATVTQVEILEAKKVFGRGTDTHYAANLAKQDWTRYKHLKNLAIVLGIQGQ